jgi:CRP/FNR family transcriptional regulator, nitrogen oxide reductase regulator
MGREENDGVIIEISNEELANEASVSTFTISRLMSEWQKDGFLMKKRGRVIIRSSEELLRSTR